MGDTRDGAGTGDAARAAAGRDGVIEGGARGGLGDGEAHRTGVGTGDRVRGEGGGVGLDLEGRGVRQGEGEVAGRVAHAVDNSAAVQLQRRGKRDAVGVEVTGLHGIGKDQRSGASTGRIGGIAGDAAHIDGKPRGSRHGDRAAGIDREGQRGGRGRHAEQAKRGDEPRKLVKHAAPHAGLEIVIGAGGGRRDGHDGGRERVLRHGCSDSTAGIAERIGEGD